LNDKLKLYDELLLKKNSVILIYGEAGTGKTNLVLHLLTRIRNEKCKGIYVSTEGKTYQALIDKERFNHILFVEVYSMEQLNKLFLELIPYVIGKDVRVVVIDTINSLYRLQEDLEYAVIALNMQLAMLHKLSRMGCTAIITGQVRGQLEESHITTASIDVSGALYLRFWSDVIIRLERMGVRRMLIVEKPINMKLGFKIEGPAKIAFYKLLQ